MRKDGRSSALWGKRSGSRSSALRGNGKRTLVAAFLVACVLVVGPFASVADAGTKQSDPAYVTPTLLAEAQANESRLFAVIVQGDGSMKSASLARYVAKESGAAGPRVKDAFRSVNGVSATLSGKELLRLAKRPGIEAITPDAAVELSSANYSNKQLWAQASGVTKMWPHVTGNTTLRPPAIAVVDSGIEKNRADFGFGAGVLVDRVMTDLVPNAPGDGRGHGTFVAGIASGRAAGYAGAAPTAPIVSLDVMDDFGMAMTSDVIRAADWILANRHAHNIRVANFSLHSSVPSSFLYDPLSKAVQKLWFNGVVVVAAAGNNGLADGPSGVHYAPGSDPFVITVGAVDLGEKLNVKDDDAAPWSAWGRTLDGFAKPELAAPGRYMIGPVPMTSTLVAQRPGQLRGTGYMELSGTSFAAPLVAGMAAYILAVNPTWTPDQVKGALMLSAQHLPLATPGSTGVGAAIGDKAAAVANPPNPNLALNAFLVEDETGAPGPVFDAASWARVASEDASWASASWARDHWESASWARSWEDASWARDYWEAASWASASWARDAWESASWASASWARYSYEDNAAGEEGVGGLILSPEEEAFLQSLLDGLAPEEEAGALVESTVATTTDTTTTTTDTTTTTTDTTTTTTRTVKGITGGL